MFDRVIEWLEEGGENGEHRHHERDVRTAVAALYYHMLSVDGHIRLTEIEKFMELLSKEFDLEDDELHDLMNRGEAQDRASPGLFPFTSIINNAFDIQRREKVYQSLVELAASDGALHPLEADLLSHIRKLLHLAN